MTNWMRPISNRLTGKRGGTILEKYEGGASIQHSLSTHVNSCAKPVMRPAICLEDPSWPMRLEKRYGLGRVSGAGAPSVIKVMVLRKIKLARNYNEL